MNKAVEKLWVESGIALNLMFTNECKWKRERMERRKYLK